MEWGQGSDQIPLLLVVEPVYLCSLYLMPFDGHSRQYAGASILAAPSTACNMFTDGKKGGLKSAARIGPLHVILSECSIKRGLDEEIREKQLL